MIPNEFGPFIAEQRKKNRLTQSELAGLLHVSTAAVSKWERGLCLPELSKFEDIASVFGLSLMEVMQCAEAEDVPTEVDAVLSDTIRLGRAQSRTKLRKWLAAVAIAMVLGVGAYLFPVYHMVQVWPLNYYTSGEIGMLSYIGSREDRDTARLFAAQAHAAFADLTTPQEELEEKYGLLRRYAVGAERHGNSEIHSLRLWAARFPAADGYGYVWVQYSNRVWDAGGDEICGSGKCPALWIFEKDDAGVWQLISIKEHP